MRARAKSPWTEADAAARDRLVAAFRARGILQRDLAEAAGTTQAQISRWVAGRARLSAEQLEQLEAFIMSKPAATAAAPAPDKDGDPGAVVDPRLVTKVAKLAGCPEAKPLFQMLLWHAMWGKSESARVRAISDLLDRTIGKATQRILDLTPKAPAEADELVTAIEKAIADHEKKNAPVAPADS